MEDDLFEGLPPPAAPSICREELRRQEDGHEISKEATFDGNKSSVLPAPPLKSALKRPKTNAPDDKDSTLIPAPALKSALKRPKSPKTNASDDKDSAVPAPALRSALKRPKFQDSQPQATVPDKRARFKTMTDASESQVIEAMHKITSHIKSPGKFGKASKLAIQLVEAGSVQSETIDHFFAILEAAMSSPIPCTDASVRADYHALFTAAQDTVEYLNLKQRNQLGPWTMRAVVANDLFTDDSFVFSKAAGRIKEAICSLPVATEADDNEEVLALKDEQDAGNEDGQKGKHTPSMSQSEGNNKEELDPFGLDALIPNTSKKDEKVKGKKDDAEKTKDIDDDTKRFLKSQRESLVACLEIAATRYKTPWCQTGIDILVKHAFDNIARFTRQQRDAIGKLWASIKEQQIRRKQGKSVSGKLDVNGFEWLQQKYAGEKISIRRSVGGTSRRAEQWLG